MKLASLSRVGLFAGCLGLALPLDAQQDASAKVDRALPSYTRVAGVAGNIKSVGSDTMNNLLTLWGEGFVELYPNVKIEIEGKGSATAPPALEQGRANFGPMSRPMKKAEIDAFEKRFGYRPMPIATGVDMIAVYVHEDNPIQGLTLPQVDAIFGKSRKGGHPEDVRTWGQLGLTGPWADEPIKLYGRNAASGTYGYFKTHALFGGDFKATVKQQPGSSGVVQGVAADRFAIGYSGIGYQMNGIRPVPLARSQKDWQSDEIYEPVADNAYTGDYPLSRFLLLYVNHDPDKDMDPLRREFLSYVLSREGQLHVVKDGYFPLTFRAAASQRAKFN